MWRHSFPGRKLPDSHEQPQTSIPPTVDRMTTCFRLGRVELGMKATAATGGGVRSARPTGVTTVGEVGESLTGVPRE